MVKLSNNISILKLNDFSKKDDIEIIINDYICNKIYENKDNEIIKEVLKDTFNYAIKIYQENKENITKLIEIYMFYTTKVQKYNNNNLWAIAEEPNNLRKELWPENDIYGYKRNPNDTTGIELDKISDELFELKKLL
jgi:hypothetical protein